MRARGSADWSLHFRRAHLNFYVLLISCTTFLSILLFVDNVTMSFSGGQGFAGHSQGDKVAFVLLCYCSVVFLPKTLYKSLRTKYITCIRFHSVTIKQASLIICFSELLKFLASFWNSRNLSQVGRLYLTTHRKIFNNKRSGESLQSFSFPFVALRDVELEQPIFGANYIKGKVIAQPNGNFQGEVKFKLHFKSGGAIEFGQAMLRAAQMGIK